MSPAGRLVGTEPPPIPAVLFWAGVASTIGLWGAKSLASLLGGVSPRHMVSDAGLLWLVGVELLIVALWVPILRRRGWSLDAVTTRAALSDIPRGVFIFVIAFFAYWIYSDVARLAAPRLIESGRSMQMGGTASWGPVLAVSIVNPVVEEFVYLGFIANVLRRQGSSVALAASLLARVVVHVYQGPFGALSNVPFGLVLAGFYLGDRRIWPVIIAHGIADLTSLATLVGASA